MNNIKIFALGGAATKMLRTINLPCVHIDTSTSEKSFLGENRDLRVINTGHSGGSGGSRGTNVDAIMAQTPVIVDEESKDINIVVFSSSGGSGSTIAHSVVSSLIEAGKSVICFVSYNPDDLNRASNTVKTLIGLDNLSRDKGVTLPLFPYMASSKGFSEGDKQLTSDLMSIFGCYSEDVVSVDFMDRVHSLNPSLMPEYDGNGILIGEVFYGYNWKGEGTPISCLTLAEDGESDNIGTGAPFIFSGILPDGIKSKDDDSKPSISVIYKGSVLPSVISKCNDLIAKYKRSSSIKMASVEEDKMRVDSSISSTAKSNGFVI